jgi:hypothetical protein
MPVKVYSEFERKYNQLVVTFLSDYSVAFVSISGTELARIYASEPILGFTSSPLGEEKFFGLLTESGKT